MNNFICRLLLCLVFSGMCTHCIHAQTFSSLGGPRGADWSPVLVEPDGTLHIQIFYNAYESTDHGDHWTQIQSDGQHRIGFTNDTYGHMFATDSVFGLVRSSDRGRSWQPLNDMKGWDCGYYVVTKRAIVSLADSFAVNGTVLSQTFISNDHGDHFRRVATPSQFNGLYQAVGIDSADNIYVSVTFGGWWRSNDDGVNWTAMPTLEPTATTVSGIIFGNRGATYVRITDNYTKCFVVRSDDSGRTWQPPVGVPVRYSIGAFDVAGNDTLLTYDVPGFEGDTALSHMLRSVDGGKTWIEFNPVFPGISYGLSTSGVYDPRSGSYYLNFFGTGHWRSRDLGNSFESVDNGINQSNIQNIIRTQAGSLLTMSDYQIASRYSKNTWTTVSSTLIPAGVDVTGAGLTRMRDGTLWSCVHGAVYMSTDDGQTWKKQFGRFDPTVVKSDYGSTVSASTLAADSGSALYASLIETTNLGQKGVAKSTDLGTSWNVVHFPNNDTVVGTIEVSPDGSVYAGAPHDLYISTDNGASWNSILHTAHRVSSITISNASTILIGVDTEGVSMTTDKGAHWSSVLSLPPPRNLAQIAVPQGGVTMGTPIIAAVKRDTSDHSVVATFYPFAKWVGLLSTDLGQHWMELPDSIGVRSVWFDSPTKAELGTFNNGVVEMTIGTKGVSSFTKLNDPVSIVPNPSTGMFRIAFGKSTLRDIEISIFDERGALVQHTAHAHDTDGGIVIDLHDFPVGRYEVRITDGTEVTVKTLVLVR